MKAKLTFFIGSLLGVAVTFFILNGKLIAQRATMTHEHLRDLTMIGTLIYFDDKEAASAYIRSMSAGVVSQDMSFQNQALVRGYYDATGLQPTPWLEARLPEVSTGEGIRFDYTEVAHAAHSWEK